MTSVSLLHVRSGFCNLPDGFALIDPDYDADEFAGEEVVFFDLPDGYAHHVDGSGREWILDPEGNGCSIHEHPGNGRPQLWSTYHRAPVLKPSAVAA